MGCTTTTVMIKPTCTPFDRPTLERVSVDELELVEDETYRKLRANELKLLNWGDTNVKLLDEVCDVGEE
ncbi:hypothetical protein NVP2044O_40 [Vibrio phage 2.044.O._10N.261.51.B8]|nr:hypothetical protein NVP2044O_40 [Vibrio phage 2.044.O._10N.261.51.B8]